MSKKFQVNRSDLASVRFGTRRHGYPLQSIQFKFRLPSSRRATARVRSLCENSSTELNQSRSGTLRTDLVLASSVVEHLALFQKHSKGLMFVERRSRDVADLATVGKIADAAHRNARATNGFDSLRSAAKAR